VLQRLLCAFLLYVNPKIPFHFFSEAKLPQLNGAERKLPSAFLDFFIYSSRAANFSSHSAQNNIIMALSAAEETRAMKGNAYPQGADNMLIEKRLSRARSLYKKCAQNLLAQQAIVIYRAHMHLYMYRRKKNYNPRKLISRRAAARPRPSASQCGVRVQGNTFSLTIHTCACMQEQAK
jgi:hypothetical protein